MQVKGAKGVESGGRPARPGPSLSLGASYINTTAVSYTDGAAVDGTGAEAWNTVTWASGHMNYSKNEVLAATRRPRPQSGSGLGNSLLKRWHCVRPTGWPWSYIPL